MATSDLDRAADLISGASRLALACHVAPDGDALGSMLALHHLARERGVASVASWSEPFTVPPHYDFLPGLDLVTHPAEFPTEPDVMVTFDCGSLERLGELATPAKGAGQLIVLDHHATNDHYGSVNVVDPDAAATAVLVRRLTDRLGWPLTREAAICLYTGIVSDTGRFQYSNTTPEVFAIAEELAEFDLPIADMTRQLFEHHRFAYLKLVAECLARAELDSDLSFVASWVTDEDLNRHSVGLDETEGLIDLLRRVAEADVSCVLKETPDGIKVSLRSVSDTDVAAVALRFGGGGHPA
ncbi:MAG TPA: bifunctional oligoribonuclease/PAP phosphatase NrnA, partial [Acidimicrobiales bacterium]|nr:bifunctional oligoribonuclease/PAP phosphatase NrnA [Acidimicrobiales bacterium]